MINLYEKVPCKSCQAPTERIDLFFGDICIKCYAKTPESKEDYQKDAFIKAIAK